MFVMYLCRYVLPARVSPERATEGEKEDEEKLGKEDEEKPRGETRSLRGEYRRNMASVLSARVPPRRGVRQMLCYAFLSLHALYLYNIILVLWLARAAAMIRVAFMCYAFLSLRVISFISYVQGRNHDGLPFPK